MAGDTLWYSMWLLDAYYHRPSTVSGIAYVELLSPTGDLVKRQALRIPGHAYSQLPLDTGFASGTYRLRAYTLWQQNFGDSLFFQKDINIYGNKSEWKVMVDGFRVLHTAAGDSIRLGLSLSGRDLTVGRKLRLEVCNGKGKRLVSADRLLPEDKHLNVDFGLPAGSDILDLSFRVEDRKRYDEKISFPLSLLDSTSLDVQFLPEGGHCVAGLPCRVAFKVLDARGTSVDATGSLRDGIGRDIAPLETVHGGTGIFSFVPKRGEKYHADLKGHGSYAIPFIDTVGTVLSVDVLSVRDSIAVGVQSNEVRPAAYYLLAYSHGLVVAGQKITANQLSHPFRYPKDIFPTGVSHFALMRENGQLLNERAFYVDNGDALHISIKGGKDSLFTRDSIPLEITVTDREGHPVTGVFSLCVTDTSRVDRYPGEENILSHYLLSSELRGKVCCPGYYFDTAVSERERQRAMDVLLLTQGFVRYDWDSTKKKYPAEPEFIVTGRASKVFDKPYAKGQVSLFSLKPLLIHKDTVTDSAGRFEFRDLPDFDTAAFVVRARTKKGKAFGIGVDVDRPVFPEVPVTEGVPSWKGEVNTGTKKELSLSDRQQWEAGVYGLKPGELAPVVVSAKVPIEGSDNLNGPGLYDEAITKKQLQQMGDTSLLDILKRKIKGFRIGPFGTHPAVLWYLLGPTERIIFIIDGIRIDDNYSEEGFPGVDESLAYLNYLNQYLNYIKASDIKGIELLRSWKYTYKYFAKYLTSDEKNAYSSLSPINYIEITTYSKQGPAIKDDASMAVYRPLPFSYGKTFYQPHYRNFKSEDSLPDIRSTVYWQPQFLTDSLGKSKIFFYSTPNANSYLINVEGTDGNGNLGWHYQYVEIKDAKQ